MNGFLGSVALDLLGIVQRTIDLVELSKSIQQWDNKQINFLCRHFLGGLVRL